MTRPFIWWVGLSLLWGAGSGLVPLMNAEAYVAALPVAERLTPARAVILGVAVGTGQTVAKTVLFLLARRGTQRWRRRPRPEPTAPRGAVRRRLREWTVALLALIGSPWGVPIIALAAVVGFPPLYPSALAAGASRMPLAVFALTVLVGRAVRFALLALAAGQGIVLLR